MARVYIRFVSL